MDAEPLLAAAERLSVPLTLIDLPDTYEVRALYDVALVLSRPDQYVAWRGDSLPEDAAALLRLVTGRSLAKQGSPRHDN